jgi:hypothetical protein
MLEASGRDNENDWKTSKVMCNTEEELLAIVKEWNAMELDN